MKYRLLTRAFDLSLEGETLEEVEKMLDMLNEHGLAIEANISIALDNTNQPLAQSAYTEIKSMGKGTDIGSAISESPTSLLGPLGELPKEAGQLQSPDFPGISGLIKRNEDVIVLAPKFPPKADGGERVDAAAMILLAAYELSGEIPVTGTKLIKSLRRTGYSLGRVDIYLASLEKNGKVLPEGFRRGRKYRLSEDGRAEARKLIKELASIAGKPTEEGSI